ncbi:hypothetical protein ACFWVP_12765 [Streptomyces sp. NPDC058637]|uniref:hypothetical protein n=1 Tax=Streptomyces sp. NPDC058637 TaxID=3346569 RepID=UPI0036581C97
MHRRAHDLFDDGLDVIGRTDSGAVGPRPDEPLRPGGPLYPGDASRRVLVASRGRPDSGSAQAHVRVRLRGSTVVRSEPAYPGLDHGVVEEVRFGLEPYVGEIERAYGVGGRAATA